MLSIAVVKRTATEGRHCLSTFLSLPHLSVVGNIIEAPVHVLRSAKKQAETEALNCWNRSA